MTRNWVLTLAMMSALALSSGPAFADWRTAPGTAQDPGGTLAISCEASTEPFLATVEVAGSLVPPTTSDRLAFTFYLDTQGYQFPSAFFDPALDSWQMPVSMSDPLVLELFETGQLIVDAGRQQAWSYQTDGIAGALADVFGTCVDAWRAAGHPVPAALVSLGSAPAATAGPPATLTAHISRGCSGGYTMDASKLLVGLIDGDDAPDYVLDWNIVRCTQGLARPFCGAANCSIDVFLSSRGYVLREGDGFLGIAPQLVPLSNGRMGMKISGTAGACATGFCDRPFWWDGTRLRQ